MRSLRWTAFVAVLMLSSSCVWSIDYVPDVPTSPTQPIQEQLQLPTQEAEELTSGAIPPLAWEKSFDAALETAAKENKPVLAEFYVTYQQWCRVLDDKTLTDTGVLALSHKFACVRIDGKEAPELVERYDVKSYPTVLFLNSRGEPIHRLVGFIAPRPFEREMKEIAGGREPQREFEKLAKSNPREFRQIVLLAIGHLRRQEWDKAIEAYERALAVGPGIESREVQEVIYSLCPLYDFKARTEKSDKPLRKSEKLLLQLLKAKDADKPKVHDMLGHTYLSLKQSDKAVAHFQAERSLVEDEKHREFLDRLIEEIGKAPKK